MRQLGQGWKKFTVDGYRVCMLAFDEPSTYGIGGGCISKLTMHDENGSEVVNYDRGWDQIPQGDVLSAYNKVLAQYN